MKKMFNALLICATVLAQAQSITISGKANVLLKADSPSWTDVTTYKGTNSVGFNVGASVKIGVPGLFVMPELYYTYFKNSFTEPITNTSIDATSSRIDVPVLVGKDVLLELLSVYLGPVLSYNLTSQDTWANFKQDSMNKFTVGYQIGAQSAIKKLIITARYEGAFSSYVRKYSNVVTGQNIQYDSRQSLFILGLGMKF
jgi:hypothetical protein